MKALALDFEVSWAVVTTYGGKRGEIEVIDVLKDKQVISVSFGWIGENEIYCIQLPDFRGHKAGVFNLDDTKLIKEFAPIVAKADVIIAHNGKKFDFAILRHRMLVHGMPPLPPIKEVDTLTMARKFSFFRNTQDNIARELKTQRKVKLGGGAFHGCIDDNDPKEWKRLKVYNNGDVKTLKENYERMSPHVHTGLPNANVINETKMSCTRPGCTSINTQRRGFAITTTGRRQLYQCRECGKYFQGPLIKSDVVYR